MYLKIDVMQRVNAGQPLIPFAKDTSMLRSTVKRAIADLIRCGFLRRESRYWENGSNSFNRYFLIIE